jgi:hypothetical protein
MPEARKIDPVVGRNSAGQIVMDVTHSESPAISLRVVFWNPEDVLRLADVLAEHGNDDESNDRAYPELRGSEDRDDAVASLVRDTPSGGNLLHTRGGAPR